MSMIKKNKWTTVNTYWGKVFLTNFYRVNPSCFVRYRIKIFGFLDIPHGSFTGATTITLLPLVYCKLQFKPKKDVDVIIGVA